MKIKVLDKEEGREVLCMTITYNTISIDTRLKYDGYAYKNYDGKTIIETSDNIISYVDSDYLLYIDN